MPSSSSGKWVQRAASTGGGRTYRGQRPVNWYASLVVICVIGLLSIVVARHEYQHPASSSSNSGPQPHVGTTWFSAESFNICGTVESSLPVPSPASTTGMTVDGQGTILIKPSKSSQAGDNAVLSQLIDGYQGLHLTASQIGYPGQKLYSNGEKCAAGTPDAGKVGTVQVAYWKNAEAGANAYQRVPDPPSFKPANLSEFSFNFLPAGATLKRPSGTAVEDMLSESEKAAESSSSTTTTPVTTTPISTTPTAPSTTTTSTAGANATTTTTK